MAIDDNALVNEPIMKTLLMLSVPIILANILQTAYQLTDTFWVGRLGADAVAAVSISFPVIFLLVSLGGGLAIAGTILIAQYKGKSNRKATDHVAAQTLLLVFFVSLILSVIGYLLTPYLLTLMGAGPDIYQGALSYMRISFMGIIFMFIFMVFQSLMRGVGDVRTPMYIVLSTVLLNLILDPLFIFGYGIIPAFGVAGAAVASVGTQALSAVIGLIVLYSGRFGIHVRSSEFKPDMKLILKMFRLGFPASIEQATRALGLIFMVVLVTGFGTEVIASYGIGTRILGFIIIPALGLSMATSTLVGQNMGAGKIERAQKVVVYSAWLGFGALTLVGVLLFIFATPISALFIPGDAFAISMSASFIRIMAFTFGFIGVQQVLNGAFRGSGNTFISMMLAIVSLWVLRFPIAYMLGYHTSLGETGIWYAFPIANVIAAAIALAWFSRGTWKLTRVTEDVRLGEMVSDEAHIEEGFGRN